MPGFDFGADERTGLADPESDNVPGRVRGGESVLLHGRDQHRERQEELAGGRALRGGHAGEGGGHDEAADSEDRAPQDDDFRRGGRNALPRVRRADPGGVQPDSQRHPGGLVFGHHAQVHLGNHREFHEEPRQDSGQKRGTHSRWHQAILRGHRQGVVQVRDPHRIVQQPRNPAMHHLLQHQTVRGHPQQADEGSEFHYFLHPFGHGHRSKRFDHEGIQNGIQSSLDFHRFASQRHRHSVSSSRYELRPS